MNKVFACFCVPVNYSNIYFWLSKQACPSVGVGEGGHETIFLTREIKGLDASLCIIMIQSVGHIANSPLKLCFFG